MIKYFSIFFLISYSAWAQTFGLYSRDQISTLPKGRFLVSDLAFQASVNNIYKYDSSATNLSDQMNRSVTYADIAKDDPLRKNQLEGLFASNDVQLNNSAGSMRGQIDSLVDGHAPVLGYGITDQLMIVATLPLLHFTVASEYQFQQSAETQKFLNSLSQQDQVSVANDFKKAFQYALETKLYKSGYQWNGYTERKLIGDAQIYILNKLDDSSLLSTIIILPTADAAKMDDLFELKGGDKKYGLGLKYTHQLPLMVGWSVTNSFSGTGLLPSNQARRLYLKAEDDLKEGADENVTTGWVGKFGYQAQLRYEFPAWVGVTTGFSWWYKTPETLSGDKYDPSIYHLNSERTSEELKSVFLAMDINSVQSFLSGKFLLPMVLELGLNAPLSGRNAVAETTYQLQGSFFF